MNEADYSAQLAAHSFENELLAVDDETNEEFYCDIEYGRSKGWTGLPDEEALLEVMREAKKAEDENVFVRVTFLGHPDVGDSDSEEEAEQEGEAEL